MGEIAGREYPIREVGADASERWCVSCGDGRGTAGFGYGEDDLAF